MGKANKRERESVDMRMPSNNMIFFSFEFDSKRTIDYYGEHIYIVSKFKKRLEKEVN